MKNKAIFLDRDGVLNEVVIKNGKPYPPANLQEVIIPNDVQPALQRLKSAGFLLIVVTNQPDVVRGRTLQSTIEAINEKLMSSLPLDAIHVCYHDDNDNCDCRKPLPGLLLQAAKEYQIDLQKSILIGDRWKDIEAGQSAGCKTIWLNNNYNEKSPTGQNFTATSMKEAVDWLEHNLKMDEHS